MFAKPSLLKPKPSLLKPKPSLLKPKRTGVTLTFGERAENGSMGMEKIGSIGDVDGLTCEELRAVQVLALERGYTATVVDLVLEGLGDTEHESHCEPACVLVIEDGCKFLAQVGAGGEFEVPDDFHGALVAEHDVIESRYNRTELMRRKVKNLHARYKICFAEEDQEPDIAAGKGTIVAFDSVPLLKAMQRGIGTLFPRLEGCPAEGNLYYDLEKCGIGFHGDAERRVVIAGRIVKNVETKKETFPLRYVFFKNGDPIGKPVDINLPPGCVYLMSEKAVGWDWRKTKGGLITLRHAAGCEKYTKFPLTKAQKAEKKRPKASAGAGGAEGVAAKRVRTVE